MIAARSPSDHPRHEVPKARTAGRREGVTGVAEIVEVQTLREFGACLLTG